MSKGRHWGAMDDIALVVFFVIIGWALIGAYVQLHFIEQRIELLEAEQAVDDG